jgi:energy-coupling factor transporter transmembrane protein EcfT
MCWPANTVGAFFLALLVFDVSQKNYKDLPYHGIIGVFLTAIFWLACILLGTSVAAAVLVVPAVFAGIFLFTIWFTNESVKNRGCCMKCTAKQSKCNPVKVGGLSSSPIISNDIMPRSVGDISGNSCTVKCLN